LSARWTTTF